MLQAVPFSRGVHIAPAPDTDPFEKWQDLAEPIRRIVTHGIGARVIARLVPAMVLKEDDFVAELCEAREKVILRQQMASERIPGQVARHNGYGTAHAPALVMRSARTCRASNICPANWRAARECAP